jgi:hypothetical protein
LPDDCSDSRKSCSTMRFEWRFGLPRHALTSGMRLLGTSNETRSFRSEMPLASLLGCGLGLRACFVEAGLPVDTMQVGLAACSRRWNPFPACRSRTHLGRSHAVWLATLRTASCQGLESPDKILRSPEWSSRCHRDDCSESGSPESGKNSRRQGADASLLAEALGPATGSSFSEDSTVACRRGVKPRRSPLTTCSTAGASGWSVESPDECFVALRTKDTPSSRQNSLSSLLGAEIGLGQTPLLPACWPERPTQ